MQEAMSDRDRDSVLSVARAQPAMTLRMRLIWLGVLLVVQTLYFLVNRVVQGGVVVSTRWDALIPLWPIWAVPYLLAEVWWAICYVWAAWKMDASLYRAFVIGMITAMLVSYVVYLLYPTYVERPSLTGNGWQISLVRLVYSSDRAYNAFPSGHTYNTVLIALFWRRWRPRQWWLWAGIAVPILLSTLFTRQHNLPDLIGGIVVAGLGYLFGLWRVTERLKKR